MQQLVRTTPTSRRRRSRTTGAPCGVGFLAAALLLAACGGGGSGGTASTGPTVTGSASGGTTPGSSSAVVGAAITGTSSGSLAATGGGVAIPVQTVAGPQDQPFLTVQVSVGGGAPGTVWLDTGSSGLIMDSSAVGPDLVPGTESQTTDYETGPMVSVISTASVTVGSASTAAPISVGVRDDAKSTFQFPAGTVGIMGIGTANGEDFSNQLLFAPQLQMPAPLNAGSTLQVAPVGQTGTWTLGPVSPPAAAVTLPMTPVTTAGGPAVPTGYPALQRGVPLCWTVGSIGPACGPTDVDAGSPSAILTGTAFSDLAASGDLIPAGSPVTVSAQNGPSVWTFTSGSSYADDTIGWVGTSLGSTDFNTGLGFLIGRVVAWNYPAAQVLVGPAG